QLSVSGYYQYLLHPVITVPSDATFATDATPIPGGTTLLAPKGSMYVGEASLVIRTARNGLKVPVGISWSNRTDLQKGKEIRGHIGFVFDTVPLLLLPRF